MSIQILSNEQLRDARNLSRISGEDLCEKVGIGRRSLQRIENDPQSFGKTAYETIIRIARFLEDAGIEFLPDGTVKRRSSGGTTLKEPP